MTGNEIKELRTRLKMTKVDFAKVVGRDTRTVWRWEASGAADINIDHTTTIVLEMAQRDELPDRYLKWGDDHGNGSV